MNRCMLQIILKLLDEQDIIDEHGDKQGTLGKQDTVVDEASKGDEECAVCRGVYRALWMSKTLL